MPSSPSVATGPRWSASDYAPAVTGSGARKLAESGVAPLVATARGYESVLPDQVRDAALRFGLGSLRAAPAVQLRTAVGTRDALVMPWYRPEDVLQAGQVGARPLISTRQYRPHEHGRPVDPQTGKTRKYLNAMGIPTGMDVHPATPADWIINPAVTLMTEGMLKADSALSAMLLAYGVPAADLSGGPDDGASLEVLRAAMTAVPQDKRVLVVSLVGVSNWHQNPEWNTIRRNGREFWVAFDGDVATKAQVWWEAHQLWEFIQSKGGRPRLLDLRITADEHGAPAAKIGVDDYLVSHGDWNQLLTRLVDELPPRPAADDTSEKVPKSWRINDTEHVSEEYDEVPDPFGSGVRKYAWQKRLNLAARVLCLEERRWSTPSEDETGMLDAASDEVAGRCEVEVTWKEDPADSAVSRAVVRGPATILADPPGDWHRRGGAEIPALVAQHPDWPPSKREWVSAIKRHRRNEVAHLAKWEHMGWVPAETGSPVFIVGEQVIGAEGESTRARPGVTEKVLAKASGFGVSMPSDDQDARDTLTRVVRTYLDDVWTDRRVAALVLATALRPIVPVRCATSVMFVGTRGRGKALALDSRIPVPISEKFPTGWACNADLEVGDEVFTADGSVTQVTSFSETTTDRDTYEVTFNDGRTVTATDDHLWRVSTLGTRSRNGEYGMKKRVERATGRRAIHLTRAGREAKAAELRVLAMSLRSGTAATAPDIAKLSGQTPSHVHRILTASGLPSEKVSLPLERIRCHGWLAEEAIHALKTTWPALDGALIQPGGWLTSRDLAEIAVGPDFPRNQAARIRHILNQKNVPKKLLHAQRAKRCTVYPVGEALLALADHVESGNRDLAPLEFLATTEEIASTIDRGYAVRSQMAIHGGTTILPVPSYVLGAWLGDGTAHSGGFTSNDPEILDEISSQGYVVTKWPSSRFGHCILGLSAQLKQLGLRDNKHIPATYLRADESERLALLWGLMDTDGTVSEIGVCELSLTNERLARDALELIRSIGIKASISHGPATITESDPDHPGSMRRRVTGTRWRIHLNPGRQVFRLSRKADVLARALSQKTFHFRDWLYVKSVSRVEPKPSRCISVAHPSGLFLAEDFIPTHNSYAAESIMAFWQSRPGQWNGSLPGTASDTAYYMENAVARTPIWVADDLAPTADARKSLSEQSSLGQILRFVHNKTGKGRMQSDGFTRNLLPPRAVFVATAENALNVPSEMDRVIPIKVYAGFLNKSQKQPGALRKMRADTDLPMKVAGTCVRYVARQGERMGWPATHEWWEAYRQEGIKEALEVIGKRDDAFRHAELGSDVALGIYLLIEVCKSCGVDAETMDLIYPMMNDIYSLAGEGYEAQTVTTPGQQTIRAMRALLTSGYAHLAGPGKAGPPIPTTDERYGALAAFYNQRVGWPPAADARDHPRPNGKQIGFVLTDRKGVLCALLDPAAAFTEARRTHPDLIPPGSGQTEAWNSAWSEGLTSTAWARKQDGSGRPRPVVRTKGLEGVPIPLNVLLGLTAEDENDLGEEQRLAAVTPPVAEAGDRDFD